jgi:hypothetical protein
MPRPHIEFIQTQDLPFTSGQPRDGDAGPPIGVKPLSVDALDHSSSSLVQFASGWQRQRVGHYLVDEELYVLAGDLTISGQTYTEHTYAFLPAGYTRSDWCSERGATVLVFLSGKAEWVDGVAPPGTLDERRLIRHLAMFAEPWTGNFHPQFPIGAGRKWLRRDPLTADETWILGTLPLRHGRRPEKHPVVEEMYLISGELIGPQGIMRPGAYFWRPPEAWHGPYGSKTGNLYLFRTVGGPLSTVYTDEEYDFDWQRDTYDPILPAELQFLVDQRRQSARA